LDEGFGLTILEALACGAPVAASRSGALPELLEGAGVLFDPCDPQDIADSIERILREVRGRAEMTALGFERARSFTWERTASDTWELLLANE
jgi:glycosyltransferase involved in cell wall biosynthesis